MGQGIKRSCGTKKRKQRVIIKMGGADKARDLKELPGPNRSMSSGEVLVTSLRGKKKKEDSKQRDRGRGRTSIERTIS